MRNYRAIVCFLRDSGRCKYSPSKPLDHACFCEQIDECARKERELLDKIIDEVRQIKRSPRLLPFEDDVVRQERHTKSASASDTV